MGFLRGNGNGDSADISASRMPATLRIGVTGHRKLDSPAMVENRVREVLAVLDSLLSTEADGSPRRFVAISPLAEGSDRIVAREVLAWKGKGDCRPSLLDAVLPMPADEYENDFITAASLKEFRELLGRARRVVVMSHASSREESYESAGRHVTDSCDILMAVLNGKEAQGRGGTADIVGYARSQRRPLIWINSETGEVHYEWDEKKVMRSLKKSAD